MSDSKEAKFIVQGNLLSGRPLSPQETANRQHLAESISFVNSLNYWEDLTFLEKVWLIITYPFRRNQT